mmetsp:Transcript_5328/g.16766  ORF Transcript_5328/g.16766 Transcript_5328/m.16766 type:complete len:250 (+) Transcript_5328:194-943(+)
MRSDRRSPRRRRRRRKTKEEERRREVISSHGKSKHRRSSLERGSARDVCNTSRLEGGEADEFGGAELGDGHGLDGGEFDEFVLVAAAGGGGVEHVDDLLGLVEGGGELQFQFGEAHEGDHARGVHGEGGFEEFLGAGGVVGIHLDQRHALVVEGHGVGGVEGNSFVELGDGRGEVVAREEDLAFDLVHFGHGGREMFGGLDLGLDVGGGDLVVDEDGGEAQAREDVLRSALDALLEIFLGLRQVSFDDA